MRLFKRVILIAVVLFIVLATTVFVLENRQPVGLVLFGWSAPQLPFAVPVVLALLVGMLIGPVLAWIASLRKRSSYTRAIKAE
ncbi:lipopolysaccharide assembly protein LapA domain-containing protein [Pseudomonas alliivorans]|uniref:lipopolysaccharide assembly protein LapA domain-containing protein n=1 Tax=Pseudomonas alliivorans TaxID=2810613 RepID=UPI001615F12D|nr:lipopolysaccharide assembly protein LapA domain-containing protein [Pseudomonas alliivorans]MCO5368426.1 lipopolysaccharide assembly protein LapA domain-containing protein [Pseudomonas alliivorans]MEE4667317.1 lipopolysaccharide assembly protein LapA domain-containing protein [Pseudomonas alliivorans]MEE4673583.1 lipopolysaccharide assembly protein LapA domain-containing protein [Pseudomonas alliivorans]MEE4696925.1 lipopolysaccharide assembly protein LapA domain-containing protein [Pseudomo